MSVGKVIGIFFGVFFALLLIGSILGWFGSVADVAQKEFSPGAMLAKYEWFINQANAIEKMDQDIRLFKARPASIDSQYVMYGSDRSLWPPHIQVQYNREKQQAREDLIAVASQRNNLVREYNAQSEKFNWESFRTNPNKPKERFHEYVN